MQGHPESPRLWERHIDRILRELGLTPTTHKPCLYSGLIHGQRVLFMHQVDDFAVAAPSESIANILFNMIYYQPTEERIRNDKISCLFYHIPCVINMIAA